MLNAHYNNRINITDYWAVGDTKTVTLGSITNDTGITLGQDHISQDVELVILGFNHDNLETSINNKSKAAVTVQLKNCLNQPGSMHNVSTQNCSWSTCGRRTWCNDCFIDALPTGLGDIIKPVIKLSNQYYSSDYTSATQKYLKQETTVDKAFLLSCIEMNEYDFWVKVSGSGSLTSDGETYEYMQASYNRTKNIPGYTLSAWWIRSSIVTGTNALTSFGTVSDTGSISGTSANNDDYGIAPAFCL